MMFWLSVGVGVVVMCVWGFGWLLCRMAAAADREQERMERLRRGVR